MPERNAKCKYSIHVYMYVFVFLDFFAGLEVSEADSLLRKGVDDTSDVISVNITFLLLRKLYLRKNGIAQYF